MKTKKFIGFGSVIVLVALIVFFSGCTSAPTPASTPVPTPGTLITPWGVLANTDAPGEDLECVGRYSGMIRGLYEKSTYNDSSYDLSIVYYKQGDVFDEAKNYFISKMESCGYKKESETTTGVSFPTMQTAKIYQADFTIDNDSSSLTVVLANINEKEYTFVVIGYSHYVYSEEEVTEQQEGQEENTQPEEVNPTGDAATWNNEIKPILENVFGNVYLTSYSTVVGQMIYLEYELSRLASDNDASALANEFENNGYTIMVVSTEEAQDTVTVKKDNNLVIVTFYRDGDRLEVSITQS